MDQSRWQQIGTIVDQALCLDSPEERSALIEKQCGEDVNLQKEVIVWLDSIDNSEHLWNDLLLSNRVLMEDMTLGTTSSLPQSSEELPEKIGFYAIKKRLGHGGMGEVYLAERSEGEFHKKVALKVIQNEVSNTDQVRRFLQERSLLSRLNHPNIARLLDGGVSGDGRPYFVMEYVDGLPITEYCAKHHCSLDQRLVLFGQVCRAVQYAHTNFIVHRDLKPDNLLVTKEGSVKVLDFGIAKLLDQELSEQTLLQTRAGQRMLSLHYASPEQITLEPVTAATDVYALGLLLYELLAEKRPFDLKGKNLSEAEHIIRNQEPSYPSKISIKESFTLKGDLDAIILKALRKEPEQRYESASRLLEDIEHYRSNQPVQARKGTIRYRTAKFMRRNKALLAALAFLIVASITFGSYHVMKLNQERNVAELEAEEAEQTAQFLTGLFAQSSPQHADKAKMTARDILDSGAKNISERLSTQPKLKAKMLTIVGEAYYNIDLYDKADSLASIGLKILQSEADDKLITDLAFAQLLIAKIKLKQSDFNKAEKFAKSALANYEESKGKKSPEARKCVRVLSIILHENGNWAASRAKMEEWASTDLPNEDKVMMADKLIHEGQMDQMKGEYLVAEKKFRKALALRTNTYGEMHAATAVAMDRLTSILRSGGTFNSEAESLQRRVVEINEKVYEKDHTEWALSLTNLAQVIRIRGEYHEAEKLFRKGIEMLEKVRGKTHPYTLVQKFEFADFLIETNQLSAAQELSTELVVAYKQQNGDDYLFTIMTREQLALILGKNKQFRAASSKYLAIINDYNNKYGPGSERSAMARQYYGYILIQIDNLEEAQKWIVESIDELRQSNSNRKWKLAVAERTLGLLRMEQQQFEEAEKLLKGSFDFFDKTRGPKSNYTKESLEKLITLYKKWDKPEKAQEYQLLIAESR